MNIERYLTGKVVLKNESGQYLIDKGRILEWTLKKDQATVYIQEDADIKIINWPNTVLKKELLKDLKPLKPVFKSEWPSLLIKIKADGVKASRLAKELQMNESNCYCLLKGKVTPHPKTEMKIKAWLTNR